MKPRLMIYGATGHSGRAVAHRLRNRGCDLVLAGRDADGVRALAQTLGSPYRVFSLAAPATIEAQLGDIGVILNAAGPFAHTAGPVIDACMRCGVHYLDLAGEWPVFALAEKRGPEAAEAGVMLMPGIGFMIVLSDCLAARAVRETPEVNSLRLAYSAPSSASRGSARTVVSLTSPGVIVRRGGRLITISPGQMLRSFNFGAGERSSVAISGADVITAAHTTGVSNIETYFEATLAARLAYRAGTLAATVHGAAAVKRALAPFVALWPTEPSAPGVDRGTQSVVAETVDRWRRVRRFGLRSLDGYTVTTATVETIIWLVLAGGAIPGFQTPARCFGPDLIDKLDCVWSFDAGRVSNSGPGV